MLCESIVVALLWGQWELARPSNNIYISFCTKWERRAEKSIVDINNLWNTLASIHIFLMNLNLQLFSECWFVKRTKLKWLLLGLLFSVALACRASDVIIFQLMKPTVKKHPFVLNSFWFQLKLLQSYLRKSTKANLCSVHMLTYTPKQYVRTDEYQTDAMTYRLDIDGMEKGARVHLILFCSRKKVES